MNDLFASLYEWFGIIPFFSLDLAAHLKGYDVTCTNYIGTPWYVIIGWTMVATTALIYVLQYHIIDSPEWNKKQHWWIFALIIIALNFFIAFIIPFNTINAGEFCNELNLSVADCIGFGMSNAIWSFILFILISTIPLIRRFSTNCRHTTFYHP